MDTEIYDIVQRDADQKKYEEDLVWHEVECKYYKENYLSSIGLIYEYIDKAGPRSINGLPNFFSMRLLNKEDALKVDGYYIKYKEIRETADNF